MIFVNSSLNLYYSGSDLQAVFIVASQLQSLSSLSAVSLSLSPLVALISL